MNCNLANHVLAGGAGAFLAIVLWKTVVEWIIWKVRVFYFERQRKKAGGAWVFPHGSVFYDPKKLYTFPAFDNRPAEFPSEIDININGEDE